MWYLWFLQGAVTAAALIWLVAHLFWYFDNPYKKQPLPNAKQDEILHHYNYHLEQLQNNFDHAMTHLAMTHLAGTLNRTRIRCTPDTLLDRRQNEIALILSNHIIKGKKAQQHPKCLSVTNLPNVMKDVIFAYLQGKQLIKVYLRPLPAHNYRTRFARQGQIVVFHFTDEVHKVMSLIPTFIRTWKNT